MTTPTLSSPRPRLLVAIAPIAYLCAVGCPQINCTAKEGGTVPSSPDAATTGSGGQSGSGAAGSGGAGSGGAGTGTAGTDGTTGVGGDLGSGGVGSGGAGTGGEATGGAGAGGMGTGGAGTGGGADDGGAGGSVWMRGCALIMHMDEPSWSGLPGEVIDSCGHNNGTAVKGGGVSDSLPNTTSAGYFQGAGAFDDRNGCVQVADDPTLDATTQITMAAWIFPTALDPDSNGILTKRTDYLTNSSYAMFLDNGSDPNGVFHLYADIGMHRFNGKRIIDTNVWYHVAVVFDGDLPVDQRVTLYVDGAPDGQFPEPASAIPVFQAPLYVGGMALPGPAQAFAGRLDEVAIWTRAFSADEINQLFQSTTPL
jgi:Concanavalin A-like lectin/glucanases superfamily